MPARPLPERRGRPPGSSRRTAKSCVSRRAAATAMWSCAAGGAGRSGLIFRAFGGDVEDHIAAGRLVEVLADWSEPVPGPFLYYPSRRTLPSPLRAFVDFVQARRGRAEGCALLAGSGARRERLALDDHEPHEPHSPEQAGGHNARSRPGIRGFRGSWSDLSALTRHRGSRSALGFRRLHGLELAPDGHAGDAEGGGDFDGADAGALEGEDLVGGGGLTAAAVWPAGSTPATASSTARRRRRPAPWLASSGSSTERPAAARLQPVQGVQQAAAAEGQPVQAGDDAVGRPRR